MDPVKPVAILASLMLTGLFGWRLHAYAAELPPASLLGQSKLRTAAPVDSKASPWKFSTTLSQPRIDFGNDCKKYECFLTFSDAQGEVVRVSMQTGTVTLAHPDKMDDTSRRFWQAISKAFNTLKCHQ